MENSKFENALQLFDVYNTKDPKSELRNDGQSQPSSLLYARRMTQKLAEFEPNASEALQLAARSQHIGRWEIARATYPMDRSGYLKWRSQLKLHHVSIAYRRTGKPHRFVSCMCPGKCEPEARWFLLQCADTFGKTLNA